MHEQQTIRKPVVLSGIGLHSGREVRLELLPADPGRGVEFVRVDLDGEPRVPARAEYLTTRPRRSALARGPADVETTEHLLAVLSAMSIHNVEIRIDGPELPGLDGSALPYYQALREAGVEGQGGRAPEIRLRQPIAVVDGASSIVAFSHDDGLRVAYTLDYSSLRRTLPAGCSPTQFLELDLTEESFAREVAPARTFVLEEEVAALRAGGLGKGASVENTLVLGKGGIIGNTLRFEDEFVRHKILDLVGDLYLLGGHLRGHVLATKSGHGLNTRLARLIQQNAGGDGAALGAPEGQGRQLRSRQIRQLLPHRYPFLLVDRVLELVENRKAVGVKNVTINEEFFQGHFPERPVMPGVLIVEAMAQLAGTVLLGGHRKENRLPLLLGLHHVKFRKTVEPGDQLILEAEVKKLKSRTAVCSTRATVDGNVVAEAEIRFILGES